MKTISLLLIGCVFLSGCAVTSQTQNGQVLGSGQTSAQQLAGSVSAAAEVVTPRMLFESAIRLNSVNERGSSYYVLFSPDGKLAYLYSNNGKTVETLQRRTLPTGTSVWNVEDDDTKNLKQTEGLWTIERRMKLLAVQPKVDVDQSLGGWIEERFEGVLPTTKPKRDGKTLKTRSTKCLRPPWRWNNKAFPATQSESITLRYGT